MAKAKKKQNTQAISRVELDAMPCQACGSVHGPDEIHESVPFLLQPRCHPGPVVVTYLDGVLTVLCAECDRPVVALHVAEHSPSGHAAGVH